MSRPRKVEVEGLAAIVAAFKRDRPDLWEELRLCPLQHGLETMIEVLAK